MGFDRDKKKPVEERKAKPKDSKGKKKSRETEPSKKWEKYAVEGGKLIRKGKPCPKCGSGVFLAEHHDRLSCGKCHYMEVKKVEHKKVIS
jgi:small subunit ribosomal protein S27Ae